MGREFMQKYDSATSGEICAEKCEAIRMATNEIRSRFFLLDTLGVCLVSFALGKGSSLISTDNEPPNWRVPWFPR